MGCRVLVLEGDVALRSAYAMQLNGLGHSVTPVASAEDALPLIRLGEFDCLLVDHKLPKMTGIDFVKCVRGIDDRVGIVLMTVSDPADVDKLCEGLGIWAVVSRSVPIATIETKIHEACELASMSAAQESAFIARFESETRKLRMVNDDLMNETGVWQIGNLLDADEKRTHF